MERSPIISEYIDSFWSNASTMVISWYYCKIDICSNYETQSTLQKPSQSALC